MKTFPFRDVLWGCVYKLGMDPARKLLTDQAESLVSYINAWVRRLYPIVDMPDWTKIEPRTPDNHIVPYERVALPPMERIFKVYLTDPSKEGTSGDAPFRLMENGVHVGFEHGPQVWLKFIEQAPRFTHEQWDPAKTYGKGALTYSPAVGECYQSKTSGNMGHDPTDVLGGSLNTVITRPYSPGATATPAQPRIMHVDYSGVAPLNVGDHVRVIVLENALIIANALFTSINPATAPAEAYAAITTQLIAALPTYTITQDGPNHKVILQSPTDFGITAQWTPSGGPDITTPAIQDQPYVPAITAVPAVRQLTDITIGSAQVLTGAAYAIAIIDASGLDHRAEYVAASGDNGVQILLGLSQAISAAAVNDPFFLNVFTAIDTVSVRLTLSTDQAVSVDASYSGDISAWWNHVPFPLDLADQVMRGAYADLLKEQGQADKASGEEQLVPTEQQAKTATFSSQPYDPLTDQQRPRSRYKVT
jgi:hypothetical protein